MSLGSSRPERTLAVLACLAAACLFQGCETHAGEKPDKYVVKRDKTGATDLIVAAKKGDNARIRQLLDGGADPNDSDDRRFTALHYLVANNHYHNDAVDLLLRRHANPNAADWDSDTVLALARRRNAKRRTRPNRCGS